MFLETLMKPLTFLHHLSLFLSNFGSFKIFNLIYFSKNRSSILDQQFFRTLINRLSHISVLNNFLIRMYEKFSANFKKKIIEMDLNNLLLFSWRVLSKLFLSHKWLIRVIWIIELRISCFIWKLKAWKVWKTIKLYIASQKEATWKMATSRMKFSRDEVLGIQQFHEDELNFIAKPPMYFVTVFRISTMFRALSRFSFVRMLTTSWHSGAATAGATAHWSEPALETFL